mmetsp:Transcript_67905/g.196580  ORF Transcript_67905/g.196580 Transcript_67905/m.196580 type:complete len:289 (-) Transcript_67905:832-1698(-)
MTPQLLRPAPLLRHPSGGGRSASRPERQRTWRRPPSPWPHPLCGQRRLCCGVEASSRGSRSTPTAAREPPRPSPSRPLGRRTRRRRSASCFWPPSRSLKRPATPTMAAQSGLRRRWWRQPHRLRHRRRPPRHQTTKPLRWRPRRPRQWSRLPAARLRRRLGTAPPPTPQVSALSTQTSCRRGPSPSRRRTPSRGRPSGAKAWEATAHPHSPGGVGSTARLRTARWAQCRKPHPSASRGRSAFARRRPWRRPGAPRTYEDPQLRRRGWRCPQQRPAGCAPPTCGRGPRV